MSATLKVANEQGQNAWRDFAPGIWESRVNVRDFIQRNYTPYEGDGKFLAGATARTKAMWQTLQPLLAKEREKGILDVSQVPAGILAHAPGYIDKENELIVGLQTDAPLKRAIMPNGGWRVVADSLKAYGYTPDEKVGEIFTKYRKTHNDGVFDGYTPEIRKARSSGIVTGLPDAYGRGRTAGINWTMPLSANKVLFNLGLTLFLANAGMSTGANVVATVAQNGVMILVLGAAVLFAIVLPVIVLGLFVFRMSYDEMAGVLAGATGNPAILAYANKLAPTDRPDVGYAMIFPSMTILKILFVNIAAALV